MTDLERDIADDPIYKQFHTNTVPLGTREAIDWSGNSLESFVKSRRIPSELRKKLGRKDSP